MKILIVCTGNICRSPTAEGVFRALLIKNSLQDKIQVDSAGTHDYHVGEAPDRRAQQHAARRGYDISGLRARQIGRGDFESFDLVLAMDRGHLQILQRLCPAEHRRKLRLFVENEEVPDPYYGGPEGFEQVLDMVEAASRDLIAQLSDRIRNHLRVST